MAGLAVLALAAGLTPALMAQAATTPAAGIQIKIGHSNKCLNVSGGSTADNARIVQYGCSAGATNDKFRIVPKGNGTYWIQGVGSGKCLNVKGGSTANNAAIIQYGCAMSPNALWRIDEVLEQPTIRIVSVGSGRCLNIPNASTADNTGLIQYGCTAAETAPNEQFYLPPTTSRTAVHRPFTSKQPISVVQGVPPTGAAVAPVYYSYISADNQLTMLTDRNPDPYNDDPNAPEPVFAQTFDYGYTGRTYSAPLQDGRVQVVSHDAAAGDVVLADEVTRGTGEYGDLADLGGAVAGQPSVGPLVNDGRLAAYAIVGGALWVAPQAANNPQTPYGAWRNLGGTGLTGTPVSVITRAGARIFALNTTGQLMSAVFEAGVLSDWINLGGSGLTGTPTAVVNPGYTSSVFIRAADGTVVTKRQAAGGAFPADWTPVGDFRIVGSPSAVMNVNPGRIALAARGTDNLIYLAYETVQGSGQFGDWVQISEPEDYPETVAASDPTTFAYDVPSGASFGIAFQSVDDLDLPVVYTFAAGTAAKSTKAAPKADFHQLDKPKKTVRLK
ncbi:hypothetical protein AFR_17060 [Actinoplanes friuliensis DSM 7358]|uniref:Ricin B lectin domain-containing protein n=2 Tax=Actinoplanes friuliensis TaxID=196914 RepID=U5W157_9ACTN|nr:hypothetical protein AFR_17060 [Actinoplanes friuliensis DSM 7358]